NGMRQVPMRFDLPPLDDLINFPLEHDTSLSLQWDLIGRRAPTQAQLKEMERVAKELGGELQHPSHGRHSLRDYQTQLMVIEFQRKKILQQAGMKRGQEMRLSEQNWQYGEIGTSEQEIEYAFNI